MCCCSRVWTVETSLYPHSCYWRTPCHQVLSKMLERFYLQTCTSCPIALSTSGFFPLMSTYMKTFLSWVLHDSLGPSSCISVFGFVFSLLSEYLLSCWLPVLHQAFNLLSFLPFSSSLPKPVLSGSHGSLLASLLPSPFSSPDLCMWPIEHSPPVSPWPLWPALISFSCFIELPQPQAHCLSVWPWESSCGSCYLWLHLLLYLLPTSGLIS